MRLPGAIASDQRMLVRCLFSNFVKDAIGEGNGVRNGNVATIPEIS